MVYDEASCTNQFVSALVSQFGTLILPLVVYMMIYERWWLSVGLLLLPPSGYTLSCGFLLLDKHLIVAMFLANILVHVIIVLWPVMNQVVTVILYTPGIRNYNYISLFCEPSHKL
ncbi:transmembrane protein, putative [Medicago truncatula]|uniref:Transmembrane protein, putative n=1 Tax=Medicago truncatula TaxID=3880 RepID=A0A072VAD9_MEDTR|nr:transmembrane protein, putative [Medicago truncatula]